MGDGAGGAGGVVTFLFTDLVDSTRTLDRLGEDGADDLRRTHFALLRAAVAETGGQEVKNLGDGLMVAYTRPGEAVRAAVAMQEAIAEHNAKEPDRALSVRIGLQAGEPVCEDGDYFGTPVVVAKRLCDAARGGQILAGDLVAGLVGGRGGHRFASVRHLELKGLNQPVAAVEIGWGTAVPVAVRPAPAPRRRRARGHRGLNLVGRAAELALLEDESALTRAGEFHCVLIAGDAGIGKTRLAAEVLARAEGATTLSARAHDMANTDAFGLWAEALDPHLQELGDDEVADLCGGYLGDLAGLFHRVGDVYGSAASVVVRSRLLAGTARLLAGLAAREPLVVLLDDAHWADASSWELLRYLARHIDGSPVLVVLTARPVELSAHDLATQVLFELDQDDLLTRLDLGTLDDAGLGALAAEIVGSAPPAALVTWLSERSGGNALYAVGLLKALLEEGADLNAPTLRRLPEGLAERIAARMRMIPPEQMAVLELLVVLGRPAAIGELAAFAGTALDDLAPVLADVVAARGVVEAERGRTLTYEMNHPLQRDLVYELIGGARRRVLHRQIGVVLRANGHVAEAARHYARAADPGEPEAVDALVDALREAEAREAVVEALGLLAELVEVLPATDSRWLRVLDALNWRAEWVADHRAESHGHIAVTALRAIDGLLTESDDPTRRAVVKHRLANFLGWAVNDPAAAELTARQAHDLFAEAGDDHQRMLVERELAWIRGLAGDLPGMQAQAEAVAAAAESAGDLYVAMQAHSAVAFAAGYRGLASVAMESNNRVLEIAASQDRTYRLTASTNMRAVLLAFAGKVGEGVALLAESKLRDPDFRDTVLLEALTGIQLIGGDYPAAVATFRDSAATQQRAASRRLAGASFAALASVETGDLAGVTALVERFEAAFGGRDHQIYRPLIRAAQGLGSWVAGRPMDAVGPLRSALTRLLEMDAAPWAAMLLPDLAEVAALADRPADAAWAADETASLAARLEGPLPAGSAALTRAWSELAGGRPAATAAREAIAVLGRTEFRGLTARAHAALGRALTAEGDRAGGAVAFEEAARRFESCGATWRREAVLDSLRRAGSAGRRALAAAMGPDSLTARERDVARLAARGATAKEIAEALFVGERTVETHLGNVYAKLGVESKLDLVRRAAELGLA